MRPITVKITWSDLAPITSLEEAKAFTIKRLQQAGVPCNDEGPTRGTLVQQVDLCILTWTDNPGPEIVVHHSLNGKSVSFLR